LIELVISIAVGVMILAAAYLCLSASLSSQKMIDPRVDLLQSGRAILALMSADLRSACPLDSGFAFLGMHRTLGSADADNLDFATHNYQPRRAREADYCELSYFVQPDGPSGLLSLWRRRDPTLAANPLEGGRREEIARGLAGVRFDYTDGLDWYDNWGQTNSDKPKGLRQETAANLTGMPRAVRITLSFPAAPVQPTGQGMDRPPGNSLVFQTVVNLELAESTELAASTGGSSSTPNADNNQNASSSAPGPMANPGGPP
jgi:hypothetical protein